MSSKTTIENDLTYFPFQIHGSSMNFKRLQYEISTAGRKKCSLIFTGNYIL